MIDSLGARLTHGEIPAGRDILSSARRKRLPENVARPTTETPVINPNIANESAFEKSVALGGYGLFPSTSTNTEKIDVVSIDHNDTSPGDALGLYLWDEDPNPVSVHLTLNPDPGDPSTNARLASVSRTITNAWLHGETLTWNRLKIAWQNPESGSQT